MWCPNASRHGLPAASNLRPASDAAAMAVSAQAPHVAAETVTYKRGNWTADLASSPRATRPGISIGPNIV